MKMAYIEPNTQFQIYREIHIDSKNTLFFSDVNSQNNYFSRNKLEYQEFVTSYQRQENTCRLNVEMGRINKCNYLRFRNASYENKWYYAFIDKFEYINNECTEITFHVDVVQTYFFDYLISGFVEREHTLTDEIGDNILPENVNCGEYVYNDYSPVLLMNEMCVIIAITDTSTAVDGTLYDGVYGSADLWVYSSTDVQGINGKISDYLQSPDSILSIYMCPLALINGGAIPTTHKLSYGASAFVRNLEKTAITTNDQLDGYKPDNNKLYTYPFCFYNIDNASGASLPLRYEFFDKLTPSLEIGGTITQPVIVTLRPCSYKGVASKSTAGGYTSLNTETIQLASYPQCSWNNDSFQAWIAQNSVPLLVGTASNILGGSINGALTGGVIGGVVGGVSGVIGLISQGYQASISADISRGSFNNGGANVAMGKQQFYGGRMSVTYDYAKMIDGYFTMYGYAVNEVKRPSRHNRENFTYVKMRDATATGSAPANALREIEEIYNNGIRFWVDPSKVGNYLVSNKPIGGEPVSEVSESE